MRGKTEAGLPEQMQRFIPEHGEGNGNPLQCSCLENPMDREWTLTTWFTDFLSPLLRPTAQEKKKISFKILLLIHNAPGHPGALMEMDNELNVFMPADTFSCLLTAHILQPLEQGVIFTFKPYNFRNISHKVI